MAQLGRKAYRYNKETGKIEECVPSPRIPKGRIDDNFCSPIDGTTISNQRKLHEHNVRHGVEQVTPETEARWSAAARKREQFFKGNPEGKKERIAALKDSFEKLEAGHKPKIRRIDDAT